MSDVAKDISEMKDNIAAICDIMEELNEQMNEIKELVVDTQDDIAELFELISYSGCDDDDDDETNEDDDDDEESDDEEVSCCYTGCDDKCLNSQRANSVSTSNCEHNKEKKE